MLRQVAAATIILGALTGAAMAAQKTVPLVWSTDWSDDEYVLNGAIDYGPEIDSFVMFLARCEAGKPVGGKQGIHLWFFVDKELFPGQTKDKDGMRKPYRQMHASLTVDGKSYDLTGATLSPEEVSGGHELSLDTTLDAPLFDLLRSGKSMFVRVDDFTMPPLSMKGAARKFDDFEAKCRKPRTR